MYRVAEEEIFFYEKCFQWYKVVNSIKKHDVFFVFHGSDDFVAALNAEGRVGFVHASSMSHLSRTL